MSKVVYLSIPISLDELSETAMRMDHDDLFKLITEIDDAAADYDFTKRLLDHFAAEIAKEDAHGTTT